MLLLVGILSIRSGSDFGLAMGVTIGPIAKHEEARKTFDKVCIRGYSLKGKREM